MSVQAGERTASGSEPKMRWLSAFLSALIIGAFGAFYLWHYSGQLGHLKQRNARLVAVAARALRESAQADALTARVHREGETLAVYVKPDPGASVRADAKGNAARADYDFTLTGVLEQVPRPASFRALVAADDKGRVLAQHPEARIEGLGQVGTGEASKADLASLPRMEEMAVGDTKLWLFCQPAKLPPALPLGPGDKPEPDGETLVFCGLVPYDQLSREAAGVSPLVVGLLLAVVALALLVPPFLKVGLLSRPERLRFADAFALASCKFLGLMIATSVIFGMALHYGLSREADGELRAVAAAVKEHLSGELHAIDRQTDALDAALESNPAALPPSGLVSWQLGTPPACGALGSASDYPYFETIAWISGQGRQFGKCHVPGLSNVQLRSVKERPYFVAARDGRATLETVRTYSTGGLRAVYSRPSAYGRDRQRSNVVALATELLALTRPILPEGVGFAVIDSRGDVLFHSDEHQALTHNLFAETDDDGLLRASAASGRQATLRLRYWGRPVQAHVEPMAPFEKQARSLERMSWSLVAFREREWLRAVSIEAIEEALMLCALFTLVVFVVPALLYVSMAGRRSPFPWPEPRLARTYVELSFSFLVTTALYLAALARCHAEDCLWLALEPPAGAAVATCVILGASKLLRRRWPDGAPDGLRPYVLACGALTAGGLVVLAAVPGRDRVMLGSLLASLTSVALMQASSRLRAARWFRTPHRLASTGFWLLFAMLPAVGILKGATERALLGAAGYSRARLDERIAARERAIDTSATRPRARYDVSADRAWDVYGGSMFTAATCRAAAPPQATGPRAALEAWILARYAEVKPVLAERAPELRVAARPACAEAGAPTVVPPTFASLVGPWPWLLLVALAGVVWAIVVWAERSVFATDLFPPAAYDLDDVKAGKAGARTVLVVPTGFERRAALEGAWYEPFGDGGASASSKPVVVNGFPFEGSDEASRRLRLERLETLAFHQRRIVYVLASRHPAQSLSEAAAPGAGERARWASLFETFEVAFARSPAPADNVAPAVARWLGPARQTGLIQRLARAWRSAVDRLLGPGTSGERRLTRDERRLAREVGLARAVFEACEARFGDGSLAALDHHGRLRRIEEAASGYYRSAWESCTAEERLTLVQLAEEGFVNPRRFDTLESLWGKGLIRHRPVLDPMSESFELFLGRPELRAPLEGAEVRRPGFGWTHLRAPLVTLAVAAGALIFVTQRTLFDSASILSTTLVTAVVPLLGQVARAAQGLRLARGGDGGGSPTA